MCLRCRCEAIGVGLFIVGIVVIMAELEREPPVLDGSGAEKRATAGVNKAEFP